MTDTKVSSRVIWIIISAVIATTIGTVISLVFKDDYAVEVVPMVILDKPYKYTFFIENRGDLPLKNFEAILWIGGDFRYKDFYAGRLTGAASCKSSKPPDDGKVFYHCDLLNPGEMIQYNYVTMIETVNVEVIIRTEGYSFAEWIYPHN